jgi:putative tricarboxylic transport membrane protein
MARILGFPRTPKRRGVWMASLIGLLTLVAAFSLAGCQAGEKYPAKPILFVVPYAPGGGSDIIIRIFDKIATETKAMPQPFVIENKAGGSGVVGKSYAKEKPADGYTLVTADDSTSFTYLAGQTPWEYDDFTFIANIDRDYNMIVVKADSPYKTLKDLIAAAKAKPKEIKMGGTGVGQVDNVHTALVEKATGAKFTYVSFDSGGQVVTNVLGGQVDCAMANPSEAYEQMRAGKVRALGISSPERQAFTDPIFKDIPTWKESGVDVVVAQWRGIAGPPKMKKEQVDWLIDMTKKVVETPQWKSEYLDKFMQVKTFVAGDDFKKEVQQEVATYKPIFQELGLYKPRQ